MKITKPSLIIDKNKCKKNILTIANKIKDQDIDFRPHFKTHQSAIIGSWFSDYGVEKITVSSVSMARYFVNAGWKDILIAFPTNILEIEDINLLSSRVNLSLTVESEITAAFLSEKLENKTGIYIKIDTGYHRTGLHVNEVVRIKRIISLIQNSKKLNFVGFLAHFGHTYKAKDKILIESIYRDEVKQLSELKKTFIDQFPNLIISVGDTPSSSIVNDFGEVDEIRPGNFVFYDIMQYHLGACMADDIAVCIACPVVAKHNDRLEIVIYGGAVHFSKEYIVSDNEIKVYGRIVKLNESSWSNIFQETFVSSLSQEHGIIKTNDQLFNEIEIGDLIGILPVHSCLTANLFSNYITLDGQVIPKLKYS